MLVTDDKDFLIFQVRKHGCEFINILFMTKTEYNYIISLYYTDIKINLPVTRF